MIANVRYWSTIAPGVRSQLDRWRRHARAIPDPLLRELALEKLSEEGFNAEAGATLATLTPRAQQPRVLEAIVAFQVMYDYLDALVEQPSDDPLRNGRQLLRALVDAVSPPSEHDGDYYRYNPQSDDGGYLQTLVQTIAGAIVELPATSAFAEMVHAAAARCAEGQAQTHAAKTIGNAELEQWAQREATDTALEWHEFLAGTLTSVMSIYALLATTDANTTPRQAAAIDSTYLSIGALSTILDSLIDHEADVATDNVGYIARYADPDTLAGRLAEIIALVVAQTRTLPNAAHHIMTLAGVVAYYTSAPTADNDFARPTVIRTQQELRPLITPVLAVLRTWRLAKRTRQWGQDRTTGRRYTSTNGAKDDERGPGSESRSKDSQRPVARYVAIITDGNGRWAQARGLPVIRGHEAGADTLRARIHDAAELGIRELTVYSFSTENWSRSEEEVSGLISMFARRVAQETPGLHKHGVRMRFIGRRTDLAQKLIEQMDLAEALTTDNDRMTLYIALNYGGRAEILDAARRFTGSTEEEFRKLLYAPDMHDPALIIRTGGEQRLSNFLLWQSAYAELVFLDELWPDFTRWSLEQCLAEYSRRQRALSVRHKPRE
ncbi:MAG TPA: polyprenyl diphosphate synthase [Solirubrobacteraceae bacterium]